MRNEKAKAANETASKHAKPKLTVDEQIAHLKIKGVAFDLCGEDEARYYLSKVDEFYDLAAYRRLFEKRIGGNRAGQYANLDFAYLVDLAGINRQLLSVLMLVALDIEQHTKMVILGHINERADEDGYSIMTDYIATREAQRRGYIESEIDRCDRNPYYSGMIRKYRDDMPAWVFVQIASFGTLIDLYRFCGIRWNDSEMRTSEYYLRSVKSIRNSAAHSINIVSTFKQKGSHLRTDAAVAEGLKQLGFSKGIRQSKMRNTAIHQIVETLHIYSKVLPDCLESNTTIDALKALASRLGGAYTFNDAIRSSFGFLTKVIDGWF